MKEQERRKVKREIWWAKQEALFRIQKKNVRYKFILDQSISNEILCIEILKKLQELEMNLAQNPALLEKHTQTYRQPRT